jgi:hypothetical protein
MILETIVPEVVCGGDRLPVTLRGELEVIW